MGTLLLICSLKMLLWHLENYIRNLNEHLAMMQSGTASFIHGLYPYFSELAFLMSKDSGIICRGNRFSQELSTTSTCDSMDGENEGRYNAKSISVKVVISNSESFADNELGNFRY